VANAIPSAPWPESPTYSSWLDWHVTNGTRPDGTPGFRGKPWSNTWLARAIDRTPHSVSNYRIGKQIPKERTHHAVEAAFFGDKSGYAELRRRFREAFEVALTMNVARDGRRSRNRSRQPQPPVPSAVEKSQSAERNDAALLDEALKTLKPLIAECEQFVRWGGKVHDFELGRFAGKVLPEMHTERERALAILAYSQLNEDLSMSSIHGTSQLKFAISQSTESLRTLPRAQTKERIKLLGFDKIASSSWFGRPDEHTTRLLLHITNVLGRPIRVNVSSIDVGACAAIRLMSLRGIEIDLITSDASGREQALALNREGDFDFVISADAPMFSEHRGNLGFYVKRLDVHTEHQAILRKKGPLGGRVPTIFLYPNSSATLQQRLLHQPRSDAVYRLPSSYHEEKLELADYSDIADRMKAGDAIFAWRPLYDQLALNTDLVPEPGSEFLLSISLFQRSDWFEPKLEAAAIAFINMFIAMWNNARANPLAAWVALLSSKGYLDDISRGISLR